MQRIHVHVHLCVHPCLAVSPSRVSLSCVMPLTPLPALRALAPLPALPPMLPLPALHPFAPTLPLPAYAPMAPFQKSSSFFNAGFPPFLSMMLPLLVLPKLLEDPGRVIAGFTLRPVLQANQFSQARCTRAYIIPSRHTQTLTRPRTRS